MLSGGKEKIRPTLYAFLNCERVLLEEGGVSSLIRIVDVLTLPLPKGTRLSKATGVGLEFVVFTRWGNGVGIFEEGLTFRDPTGKTHHRVTTTFTLEHRFRFQQVRHNASVAVREPGRYAWLLDLDGELVADLPFEVRFERTTT